MTDDRPPKKSDKLVLRIPHRTKQALLDASRAEGRTASEVVRELIEGWLERAARRERLRDSLKPDGSLAMTLKSPFARAAAAAAAVLGAFAAVTIVSAPSTAQVDLRAVFAAIDGDGDGRVTHAEYAGTPNPTIAAVVFDAGGGAAQAPSDAPEYWFPISRLEDPYEMLAPKRPDRSAVDVPPFDPATSPQVYEIRRREFQGFDRDGDGVVSLAEYESRHAEMIAATFARLDANGDGRLAGGEFARIPVLLVPPGAPPMALPVFEREGFEATDRDGDGALSLDEFQTGPG
jgi:hypothetical protein